MFISLTIRLDKIVSEVGSGTGGGGSEEVCTSGCVLSSDSCEREEATVEA